MSTLFRWIGGAGPDWDSAKPAGTVVVTVNNIVLGANADVSGDLAVDGASLHGRIATIGQDGAGDLAIGSGSSESVAAAVVGAGNGSAGTLTIDANIGGDGTIEPSMTLEVNGGSGAGVDIAFGPSIGARVGELILDVPTANLGTVTGFAAGNTIVVENSLYTDAVFTQGVSGAAGTLTLSAGTLAPLSFAVEGTDAVNGFVATPDLNETDVTLCFIAGTQIATPGGEVPVEQLGPGDKVMTVNGIARRIVWIGVGKILVARGQRSATTPVIVRAGALDANVPCRDLRVTKGHALFIDGVLIPVEELINQRSILWDDRPQEFAIYHIELATHDVLLANGAPAESYRDDGNRVMFGNAGGRRSPSCQTPCAPLVSSGPVVDGIWRHLLDRATSDRTELTGDPDVHLVADGVRVDPVAREEDRYVFRLPATPRSIRIRSRSAVPQDLGVARDPRPLGVAVRQIILGGPHAPMRAARADDERLTDGFHDYEPDSGIRWTNGDAAVPAALLARLTGPLLCTLEMGARTRYLDESRTLHAA